MIEIDSVTVLVTSITESESTVRTRFAVVLHELAYTHAYASYMLYMPFLAGKARQHISDHMQCITRLYDNHCMSPTSEYNMILHMFTFFQTQATVTAFGHALKTPHEDAMLLRPPT